MADKSKMDILVFEGKAADFTTTEKTKVNDDGKIDEKTTYDVKVQDEDGHSVALRQMSPWNIRPGEWVRIKIERTQKRLDEIEDEKEE